MDALRPGGSHDLTGPGCAGLGEHLDVGAARAVVHGVDRPEAGLPQVALDEVPVRLVGEVAVHQQHGRAHRRRQQGGAAARAAAGAPVDVAEGVQGSGEHAGTDLTHLRGDRLGPRRSLEHRLPGPHRPLEHACHRSPPPKYAPVAPSGPDRQVVPSARPDPGCSHRSCCNENDMRVTRRG